MTRYRVYQITTRVWESTIEVDPESEAGQEFAEANRLSDSMPHEPTFVMDRMTDRAGYAGEDGLRLIGKGRILPVDEEPEELARAQEEVNDWLSEYGIGTVHWEEIPDDPYPDNPELNCSCVRAYGQIVKNCSACNGTGVQPVDGCGQPVVQSEHQTEEVQQ